MQTEKAEHRRLKIKFAGSNSLAQIEDGKVKLNF
jgi:hypothetical protein